MEGEDAFVIVYVTTPPGKAKEIARYILENRLAACINITSVESLYWWNNVIEEDTEKLLIIKTAKHCLDNLINKIKEIHPYQVPEIIATEIVKGSNTYLEWIKKEVSCREQ